MADPAEHLGPRSLWSSPDAFPVEPNDAENLPEIVRALRAGVAGEIHVTTWAGKERTLKFESGETRYISVVKVWETDTTAQNIEGMT